MQTPETIKLMGGALSLDFANSTDWTEDGELIEDALVEPDSLERWGCRVGIAARADEDELAAARELRPALRAVLISAAHGETPDPAARDLLMRTYAEAAAAARLRAPPPPPVPARRRLRARLGRRRPPQDPLRRHRRRDSRARRRRPAA